jgi:hypothetical protein
MGLRSSSYITTKTALLADEMVMGDRQEEANPFHWDLVMLNLPGNPSYNHGLPWVSK